MRTASKEKIQLPTNTKKMKASMEQVFESNMVKTKAQLTPYGKKTMTLDTSLKKGRSTPILSTNRKYGELFFFCCFLAWLVFIIFFVSLKSKLTVKNNFRNAQELMNPRPTIKKHTSKKTFFPTKVMKLGPD